MYVEDDDYHTSPLESYDDLRASLPVLNTSVSTPTNSISNMAPLPKCAYSRRHSARNVSREENFSSRDVNNTPTTTTGVSKDLSMLNHRASIHVTNSLPNCNTVKRKRSANSSTSSSEARITQPDKKSCKSARILSKSNSNLRVSFAPQRHNNSDTTVDAVQSGSPPGPSRGGNPITHSTSMADASVGHAQLINTGTDMDTKGPRARINPMAEPMWLASRKHAVAEQKLNLRAAHLKALLDDDIMPEEFLGAEKLHRYYATANGVLSTAMMTLLGTQARAVAELVHSELVNASAIEQQKGKNYLELVKQIYTHEEDDSFEECNEGLDRVLTFFRKGEITRLEVLAAKERARQPQDEKELTDLICQAEQRPARSTSRGRKRARNNTPNSRNNTPNNRGSNNLTTSTSATNQAATGQQQPNPRNNQQQPRQVQQAPPRNNNPGTNNPRFQQDQRVNSYQQRPRQGSNRGGGNNNRRGGNHGNQTPRPPPQQQ